MTLCRLSCLPRPSSAPSTPNICTGIFQIIGPDPLAGPLLQRGCMCQLQMYYLITNFHSLTSQNIGEKLQNMLCMLLIRLDRETANSGCIIIFQCYIGYKTSEIECLHFGRYLPNPPVRWSGTAVSKGGLPGGSQNRPFKCWPTTQRLSSHRRRRTVLRTERRTADPKTPGTSALITEQSTSLSSDG